MDKWLAKATTSSAPNKADEKVSETEKRKKPLKKTHYKFCNDCLHVPEFKNWLQKYSEDKALCKICDTKIVAHKADLLRHISSEKHKTCARHISNTKSLTDMLVSPHDQNVKAAEIKLTALLAEKNLPFTLMDTLSDLCGTIFHDSAIAKSLSIHRTKATAIMKNCLGESFRNKLYKTLSAPGTFFSLIMDETTDTSSKKQCAFSVIYFDTESQMICTRFFDMVELAGGTAENLYQALVEAVTNKNIPITNLIGFSSDTTNVMVGEHNSVFSNLKKNFPDIVCVKCSCHMIHLAASKACLNLPRSVEDLLRGIGAHFKRSFARQERFREFQQFFHVEIHKILTPSVTRWLSLKMCVDRVLEQYSALHSYLRELVFEDPSKATSDMLNTMDNKFTEVYLEFMSYVLGILCEFNVMFQGTSPLLYKLKPEVKRILRTICLNYMNRDSVIEKDILIINHKDPKNFVTFDKLYLGISAFETIAKLKLDGNSNSQEFDKFYKSCLQFYIDLVSEIKNSFIFNDSIFDMLEVIDPKVAQGSDVITLQPIINRFSFLKQFVDPQALDNEGREHNVLDYQAHGLHSCLPPDQYWKLVFNLRNVANDVLFANLKIVISLLMILPFSNASVERIFSSVKNIKTEHRNKLDTSTMTSLLVTKEGILEAGGSVKFQPSQELLKRIVWKK